MKETFEPVAVGILAKYWLLHYGFVDAFTAHSGRRGAWRPSGRTSRSRPLSSSLVLTSSQVVLFSVHIPSSPPLVSLHHFISLLSFLSLPLLHSPSLSMPSPFLPHVPSLPRHERPLGHGVKPFLSGHLASPPTGLQWDWRCESGRDGSLGKRPSRRAPPRLPFKLIVRDADLQRNSCCMLPLSESCKCPNCQCIYVLRLPLFYRIPCPVNARAGGSNRGR